MTLYVNWRLALIVCALFVPPLCATAAERVWKNARGDSWQAEFVREADGEVTFLQNGKLIFVKLADLSAADQQTVRQLSGQGGGGSPTSDPAPANDSGAWPPAMKGTNGPAAPAAKRPEAQNVTRVWTDIYGNQTTGKFVRLVDGMVVVSRGPRVTTVRFYDLTPESQEFVKNLLTSQGQEALIPPPLPVVRNPNGQDQGEQFRPPAEVGQPVTPTFSPRQPNDPSPMFTQLQEREKQRREEHTPDEPAAEQRTAPVEAEKVDIVHGNANAGNATANSPAAPMGLTTEIRGMVLVGIVVLGVVGIVAIIVFVCIVIAGASSVSRHRQYR